MLPFLFKLLVAGCCCTYFIPASLAQTALIKNTTVDGDLLIQSPTRQQEPLYRGAEYWWYPFPLTNGIAYYGSDSLTMGEVDYYGRRYQNVPLIYDQVTGELITMGMSGYVLLRLFGPEVKSFVVHDAKFINLRDTADAAKNGFWEILINDNTSLLKKENKSIKTRVLNSQIAYVVQSQVLYRFYKSGRYIDVGNRETMLGVFSDRKDEISAFLRKNKRKFRKAGFEETLKQTTSLYNQITAQR